MTVFSGSSRDLVLRVWPDLADRVSLKPHEPPTLPRKVAIRPGRRPTVGVLGAISRAKGAEILRNLAAHAGDRLRIVVIGTMDPAYAHHAIRVHGPYDHADIADLAEHYGIDRWLIPAIWPETFSYATHECIATGLPVFAFDLGAQGEAVAPAPNGRVADANTGPRPFVSHLFTIKCHGVPKPKHSSKRARNS
ncbi:hypothetical protein [Rhodovulum steppense]|uniref:Glycosyl transferase family 1 n=1 Tax=Rhodovulum steppense TaxID=540251 RepID=A0A4R1YHW1_9RHOB|nr:hypothetical protein [Rhodovulum steppense]TCM75895.1 hypothetical protein EV216_13623 [Rhodovulum steppense]